MTVEFITTKPGQGLLAKLNREYGESNIHVVDCMTTEHLTSAVLNEVQASHIVLVELDNASPLVFEAVIRWLVSNQKEVTVHIVTYVSQ